MDWQTIAAAVSVVASFSAAYKVFFDIAVDVKVVKAIQSSIGEQIRNEFSLIRRELDQIRDEK